MRHSSPACSRSPECSTVVTRLWQWSHQCVTVVTWQFDSGHLTVSQWSPDCPQWSHDCMIMVTWLRQWSLAVWQWSPDCDSHHLTVRQWTSDRVTLVTWPCDSGHLNVWHSSPIWPWPCGLETFAHREQVKRLPLQMLDKQFSKDSEHHCVKGTSESLFKKSADSKEKNYFLWLL